MPRILTILRIFFPLLVSFATVSHAFADEKMIDTTQCEQLGGEIINTLTQKNCEPPDSYLGTVSGVRCPCICCKKPYSPKTNPDYSLTIIDKDGHEVSANTVIVSVNDGVAPERVNEIAKDVGGHARVIGVEIGAYEIVIPTVKNAAELDAVIAKLKKYKDIKYVEVNGITRIDDPVVK